jgi:fermentation-respiration switch protein FrsA (DUF1100 family)
MSTSSRTTGKSRFRRRLNLFLVGLAGAYVCLVCGASFLYTYSLLHPGCPPSLGSRPGLASITLTTSEGLTLKGWWRAPQNGIVVLLIGGLGANRDSLLDEAEMLVQHGFGVLLADTRPCAGAGSTLGLREVEDLRAMSAYAASQPGVEKQAVMGFSVGGVTAILGAVQIPAIHGVIAMGNFPNLAQEISASSAPALSPDWQVQQLVLLFYWLQTGIPAAQVSPVDAIRQISPRPVLLIHGQREAPRTQPEAQLQAAGEPRSLWIVPGVGHGGYYQASPPEFERRVVEFLLNLP